jgi:hypothetical protein
MTLRIATAAGVVVGVLACSGASANAQTCELNFQVEGVPMITALNYRTSQVFPGVPNGTALNRLRSAMLAEGFVNVNVDRAAGALTAFQETSGSGRPQTLRVSARPAGKGTRVDAVFMVQAGQLADSGFVRSAICRVVSAVQG